MKKVFKFRNIPVIKVRLYLLFVCLILRITVINTKLKN